MVVGLDGIARGRRAGSTSSFGQDMSSSTLLREQARQSTAASSRRARSSRCW
jgi:hypothetical protein